MSLFDIARRLRNAAVSAAKAVGSKVVNAAATRKATQAAQAAGARMGMSGRKRPTLTQQATSQASRVDQAASSVLQGMGATRTQADAAARGKGGSILDELGPAGRAIKSLVTPTITGDPVSQAREMEAIAAVLQHMAGGTRPPSPPPPDGGNAGGGEPPDDDDEAFANDPNNNGMDVAGWMFPVVSSNVHSIGFIQQNATMGVLLVRFLGTNGRRRAGPGPMYQYSDVPLTLWREFQRVSSKGTFVWDELRVRGTVSGHRFAYDLVDIVNNYVPRQAGLKRGENGEYFLQRRFRGQTSGGERKVRTAGPNLEPNRGSPQGAAGVKFVPRGTPNRGAPNRGRP